MNFKNTFYILFYTKVSVFVNKITKTGSKLNYKNMYLSQNWIYHVSLKGPCYHVGLEPEVCLSGIVPPYQFATAPSLC